ncbi:FtsX-like permease family protein [Dactylosporangium siamense]|uniref:ABC transporter permease n=1 Tax=Dactylosporangium siamense TaxID=685454 RepID=A0A919PI96_9ACTN|nr:ABC transporter permease [Dactylosporangium siamense]GIG42713.1 ABC transporter permease [Dactylosporangium siamense]
MIRLAIGTLRRHRGAYAGTFLAALLAVALLSGGGLLLASVLTATPPADRFAAAAVVVSGERAVTVETVTHKKKKDKDKVKRKVKTERLTGAGTLPTGLAARLADLPGVAAAVPDLAFPVEVTAKGRALRGADGAPVVGHGWASAGLTPYTLRNGNPPGRGEAVLDADLAARAGLTTGAEITVTSRTGVRALRISGIAAPAGRDGLPAQGALFVADTEAAALSGLDGPTAIGILAAPGAGDLRAAVEAAIAGQAPAGQAPAGQAPAGQANAGQANAGQATAGGSTVVREVTVLTGDDRVRADLPGALPDYIAPISIFGFLIGITAFAAVFVLTGTVTLGVRQRLRELALLRTAGATPGQLRRLLSLESLLLAGCAAIPGAPLGIVAAETVAARFRRLGAVPPQFTVQINPLVLIAAAAAGLLVTAVAARIAGRRAARIAPTQALTETAVTPAGGQFTRVLSAAVAAGGAVAVLTFVPLGGPFGMGMSFVSSALLLCAVAALGPIAVRPLTAVVSRLLGAGPVGRLAGQVTRAEPRRVAAVAVPLVLMFAINATMLLNSRMLTGIAAGEQAARTAPATAQVTAPQGLALSTAETVMAVDGITGAAATIPTRIVVVAGGKPEDHAAQGLLITGTQPALDLGFTAGGLPDGGFAASRYLAGLYDWTVGQDIELRLADGHRVQLRLTGVYDRSRGFGDAVLPAALIAAHDPRGLVRGISVRYDPGTAERIRAAGPGVIVTPSSATEAAGDAQEQQGAWELMVAVTLGFTAIAILNTFAIATTGRRREFAGLRLAGATTGQLHRLAAREALIVVTAGLALGALITGIVVGTFSVAQDGVFRVIVDPATYATMAAGVAALGLLAGVLPARVLLRRQALPALTDDQ